MLYFAFGMNLDPEYMWDAVPVGSAELPGYELSFSVYATVREREGATAYGGLWRITDEHLAALDRREGYVPGRNFNHYDRRELPVRTKDGEVTAIVYVMEPQHVEARVEEARPGYHYVETIERGYRFFDLPDAAYEELVRALDRVGFGSATLAE